MSKIKEFGKVTYGSDNSARFGVVEVCETKVWTAYCLDGYEVDRFGEDDIRRTTYDIFDYEQGAFATEEEFATAKKAGDWLEKNEGSLV